jgi:hypothetical protein
VDGSRLRHHCGLRAVHDDRQTDPGRAASARVDVRIARAPIGLARWLALVPARATPAVLRCARRRRDRPRRIGRVSHAALRHRPVPRQHSRAEVARGRIQLRVALGPDPAAQPDPDGALHRRISANDPGGSDERGEGPE